MKHRCETKCEVCGLVGEAGGHNLFVFTVQVVGKGSQTLSCAINISETHEDITRIKYLCPRCSREALLHFIERYRENTNTKIFESSVFIED
jgi:hypothetical protein